MSEPNTVEWYSEWVNELEAALANERASNALLETYNAALEAERDAALGLLAYFMCHMPHQDAPDALWQQMWNEASALVFPEVFAPSVAPLQGDYSELLANGRALVSACTAKGQGDG